MLLRELSESAASTSMQQAITYRKNIESALNSTQAEFNAIALPIGHLISTSQGGYVVDPATLSGQNTLGAIRLDGRGQVQFQFRVKVVGAQLITTCTSGNTTSELLRTDATSPNFDEIYRESLRLLLVTKLQEVLTDG